MPMAFLSVLLIALALAVDAFAVALAAGISLCGATCRQTFRLAWHFGLFQGGMTVIGWSAGLVVRQFLEKLAPWCAFGLLAFVGGRMIFQGLRTDTDPERSPRDPTRGRTLVFLSVATSIDALAVGLGFSVLKTAVWLPALTIGAVAAILTAAGLHLGCLAGASSRLGSRAEIAGGLVLLAIGVNILHQHGIFP